MEIYISTIIDNLLKKWAINLVAIECFKKEKNVDFPTPGIEPGPPGWEPGILTTRQCRIAIDVCNKSILFLIDFYVRLKCHMSLTPVLYAGKMMAKETQS